MSLIEVYMTYLEWECIDLNIHKVYAHQQFVSQKMDSRVKLMKQQSEAALFSVILLLQQ